MLTTDKQQYKPGSLLELAKKKLAEKEAAVNAQNERASSLMTNPYTKVSTPYNQLRQQPTPSEPTILQNIGQVVKEQGISALAVKGAKTIGEPIGDILGRIVGASTGAILGAIIKPNDDESRIQNALEQAKKLSKETGQFGRQTVGEGFAMFPRIIQTSIKIGKVTPQVLSGHEEEFINYVSDRLAEANPEINSQIARNLLLTGNDEGDINNIDKNIVTKAWFAGLLPIGLDLWAASGLATSAFNNYYAKNPTVGYKPTESIKMDFDKGVANLIKKDQPTRTEIFKPKEGFTGKLEITKAEPTLGRKLASPLTQINKPLIKSQYTPAEQARLQASAEVSG